MLFVRSLVGGLAGGLLLVTTALAQAPDRPVDRGVRRDDVRATHHVRRISTIMNAGVSLEGSTSVGKVVDFVLNDDGCVDYLVVSAERKFILVPWTAARVNFDNHTVVLNVTRERWREVPTFTEDRWADIGNTQYIQKVRSFYRGPTDRRGIREDRREQRQDRRDNRRPPDRP